MKIKNKNSCYMMFFVLLGCILLCHSFSYAATRKRSAGINVIHEVAPFMGYYAPDRFETSVTYGIRYFYHVDNRLTLGAILGFANARQKFVRETTGISIESGSERVIYHGARAAYTFLRGRVKTYPILHFGLTRLYDENSFTYGFGLGTKIQMNKRIVLRYELLNFIFNSCIDRKAWTNKNIEITIIVGFKF